MSGSFAKLFGGGGYDKFVDEKIPVDEPANLFRRENIAIAMTYFAVGVVHSFSRTPLNIYMVNTLNVEPEIQSTIGILGSLPWSFKLLFGFISDAVPIQGMHRSPYLTLGTLIYSLAFLLYGIAGSDDIILLAASIFTGTTGLIMFDVMADTMCVERSRFEPEATRGQMQASCYSIRFAGGLIGAILGSCVCNEKYWGWGLTYHQVSCINGMLPCLLILPFLPTLREKYHRDMLKPEIEMEEIRHAHGPGYDALRHTYAPYSYSSSSSAADASNSTIDMLEVRQGAAGKYTGSTGIAPAKSYPRSYISAYGRYNTNEDTTPINTSETAWGTMTINASGGEGGGGDGAAAEREDRNKRDAVKDGGGGNGELYVYTGTDTAASSSSASGGAGGNSSNNGAVVGNVCVSEAGARRPPSTFSGGGRGKTVPPPDEHTQLTAGALHHYKGAGDGSKRPQHLQHHHHTTPDHHHHHHEKPPPGGSARYSKDADVCEAGRSMMTTRTTATATAVIAMTPKTECSTTGTAQEEEDEYSYLPENTHSIHQQLNDIWMTVQLQAVWRPMAFVYIYNILQVPNVAWNSFLQLTLNFEPWILGLLVILGSLMTFAGTLAYKYYFFKTCWRKIFLWTTFLVTFFSFLQLILIFQINVKYLHLSNYFFSVGDDVITAYIAGIQFLPMCIMYSSLCPDGAEGSTYSMLTTFGNIAGICSRNIGISLSRIWDVSNGAMRRNDVAGLWRLNVLTALLSLLPLSLIWLLPKSADEQAVLSKSPIRSKTGGAIFLLVLFVSLAWTILLAVVELFENLS